MKVLGICASQRKLGNSEILLKEMLSHFPDRMEKNLIRTTDLNILPCNACYACLPEDKPCVLQDDFNFLLSQIQSADIVLIASPVYFLGMHNSLKMIQDRFISILNKGHLFPKKKCLLAIPYGIKEWEGAAYSQLNAFAQFLNLEVQESLLIQAPNPGEVITENHLADLKTMVDRLLANQKPEVNAHQIIYCPACQSDLLQFYSTGKVRCIYCNYQGQAQLYSSKFSVNWEPNQHLRFSASGLKAHAALLESIKNQYLSKRQQLNEIRKPYRNFDFWWVNPKKV